MSNEESQDKSTKKLIVVLLVVMLCCCGGPALLIGAPFAELTSATKQDFGRQCDIALGPAAGTTRTTSPVSVPVAPPSPSPTPTGNPYAVLSFAADDPDATPRDRECAAAMRVAPRQGSPLGKVNNGPAAMCAGKLALRYPEAGGVATAADYLRDVIYSASVGRCIPGRAPYAGVVENCGDTTNGEPVILPQTVREQAFCGHAVAPAAVSAGDLVFWGYEDNAELRAGIALGADELVTVVDGKFVRSGFPGTGHVQVKRVLREVS